METSLRYNIIPEILFGVLNASQGFLIFAFHVSLSKSKRQIWEEFFRVKSNKLRKDVSKLFNSSKKENESEIGIESAFKPVIKSKSEVEEEETIEKNKGIIETDINDKVSSDTQKLESDKLFTICQFEQQKNRSSSCSSVTTTTKTVKQLNEDRRFVPIGAYKKCASFLTTSKSIHDSLETNGDGKTNCCSTPEIDHNSINYFSDDISARISRLNESLRRIKNTEKKSLTNKFSPVSFKLDDLSTLFYDQL